MCWGVRENSLRHESFNAIVEKRRVDATEVLVRNGCMSKQALMGTDWTPSALVSRRTAALLHDRLTGASCRAHAPCAGPGPPPGGADTALSARGEPPVGVASAEGVANRPFTTPRSARGRREGFAPAGGGGSVAQSGAATPVTGQGAGHDSAAGSSTGRRGGETPLGAHLQQPFPVEGLQHPHTGYSPHETRLSRDSYNSIINRSRHHFDPSESLVKENTLGRQALMGQAWMPTALMTRQLAKGGGPGSPSSTTH